MLADYNVRTYYSADSDYPMEEAVLDGLKNNLDEICFTDRVDYGVRVDWDSVDRMMFSENGDPAANVDYPSYFEEIGKLQKKYYGKIVLKKGLECGVQSHTVEKYEALLAKYPLDCAVLTIRQIEDMELWNGNFQLDQSRKEAVSRYYKEMYEIVEKFSSYSVISYFDQIGTGDRDLIAAILKKVIADGKGLMVNTCWKNGLLLDSMPEDDVLKLYYDLGGKILTFGSGMPGCAGNSIRMAKERLVSLGFREFCTFESFKPVFHALEE